MKECPFYTVIYSDDSLVALNKRSGLLVASDRYDPNAARLDSEASKEFGKLYAVHRIDKDTSGLVLYARTEEAHRALSLQFQNREVHKVYHCLVTGHPLWKEQRVDIKLMPDGDKLHRTTVNRRGGKDSITDFRLIGNCGPYSWIEARPLTGRTHQIRAHLHAIGLDIACDSLYARNASPIKLSSIKHKWHGDEEKEVPLLSRLALHAYSIEFKHPVTRELCSLKAPYPRDMEAIRKQLAKLFDVDPLKEN